jgi:hypothetical protein
MLQQGSLTVARRLHLCCTIPGSEKFGKLHISDLVVVVVVVVVNDFHSKNIKIKFIYLFCN